MNVSIGASSPNGLDTTTRIQALPDPLQLVVVLSVISSTIAPSIISLSSTCDTLITLKSYFLASCLTLSKIFSLVCSFGALLAVLSKFYCKS